MSDVEALRHTVAEIIPFHRILAISIASVATDSQEHGYNAKIEL